MCAMTVLQALVLSLVEGVAEFLPISSTGHLILAARLLDIPQTEFVKSFEIIIQLGAILAVVFLYWRTLLTNRQVWPKVLVAFIPTAFVGLVFYRSIKDYLIGNTGVTLAALFFGGVALILIELRHDDGRPSASSIADLSYKNAFLIGACQSISVVPGVSRAAATILGALLLGTSRSSAVEFSFLLAVPTMAAATGLDLVKSNISFSPSESFLLLVGFLGSFVTALICIKLFIRYVQRNNFIPFGIYRVSLAVAFWLIVLR